MKLSEYMKKHGLKDQEFADIVGAGRSTITRVRNGDRPCGKLMLDIEKHTKGKVKPNDFYGV